jgi:hypothetical protein
VLFLTLKIWKDNNNSRYEKKLLQLNFLYPKRFNKDHFNPYPETLGFIMELYKNRQITILARRLVLILYQINRLRGHP